MSENLTRRLNGVERKRTIFFSKASSLKSSSIQETRVNDFHWFFYKELQGLGEDIAEAVDEDFSDSYLRWKQDNRFSTTTQQASWIMTLKMATF